MNMRFLLDPRKPSRPIRPGGHLDSVACAADRESEERLLGRLRAGDEEAYEELVRRYGGPLLALARLRLRDAEDARDAVQDTFLSVFRGLPRFRGTSSLSTWLHRILLNAVLMRIRTRSRHPEAFIEDWDSVSASGVPEGSPDPFHNPPRSAETAETVMMRAEIRARVRSAVDSLPDSYRSVLALRDLQEVDTPRVARLLSTTPSAVRIRLYRARRALRTRLSAVAASA